MMSIVVVINWRRGRGGSGSRMVFSVYVGRIKTMDLSGGNYSET